jgi:hypothetical protein
MFEVWNQRWLEIGNNSLTDGEILTSDCEGTIGSEASFFIVLIFLPLALQPAVGFGLSNNISPFFPIYHQLSSSSHFQHLKISL